MHRRGFLRGLALAPLAAVTPTVIQTSPLQAQESINRLCPIVWEKFAEFHSKIMNDYMIEHLSVPIILTSERMMRRHPEFFTTDTMLNSPCNLVDVNGVKYAIVARRKTLKTFGSLKLDLTSVPHSIKESWQDSLSTDRLLGQASALTNQACDELAALWKDLQAKGNHIFPYLPLFATNTTRDGCPVISFSSRYGMVET